MPFPRSAGVLLHPTSLPGGLGVGDLGESAHRFVDFLHAAGMGLWQVLPLGPTSGANSPYQSLSSFAGNPLLISLDALAASGLLRPADLQTALFAEDRADYVRATAVKEKLLRKAFETFASGRGDKALPEEQSRFRRDQAGWLDDFALFVALRARFGGRAWFDWPDADLAARKPAALAKARKELERDIVADCVSSSDAFAQMLWDLNGKIAVGFGIERVTVTAR